MRSHLDGEPSGGDSELVGIAADPSLVGNPHSFGIIATESAGSASSRPRCSASARPRSSTASASSAALLRVLGLRSTRASASASPLDHALLRLLGPRSVVPFNLHLQLVTSGVRLSTSRPRTSCWRAAARAQWQRAHGGCAHAACVRSRMRMPSS